MVRKECTVVYVDWGTVKAQNTRVCEEIGARPSCTLVAFLVKVSLAGPGGYQPFCGTRRLNSLTRYRITYMYRTIVSLVLPGRTAAEKR